MRLVVNDFRKGAGNMHSGIHRKIAHIGFEGAAKKAAIGAGVSLDRGRAIIAEAARHAGKAAKRRNPRLRRVSGA